jgi:hypothetical protein
MYSEAMVSSYPHPKVMQSSMNPSLHHFEEMDSRHIRVDTLLGKDNLYLQNRLQCTITTHLEVMISQGFTAQSFQSGGLGGEKERIHPEKESNRKITYDQFARTENCGEDKAAANMRSPEVGFR